MSEETQSHVVVIDGKKFYSYEIRVQGGFVYGWDARPIGGVRKAWIDAWKAHATTAYSLSEKKNKANIKNVRAMKLDEVSFGSEDDPDAAPSPQWSPNVDEMLILTGVTPLDDKGSLAILADKVVGIAYREDRKKA